jgi:hypothetical protein
MVNGSGSLKIVDIYYENDLTLIEFCFSRKGVKWHFMGEPLEVNFLNYDYGKCKALKYTKSL